jgi:hypothetical protein
LDFLLLKPVTHCAKTLVRFGFRNPGFARPQIRYPAPSLLHFTSKLVNKLQTWKNIEKSHTLGRI